MSEDHLMKLTVCDDAERTHSLCKTHDGACRLDILRFSSFNSTLPLAEYGNLMLALTLQLKRVVASPRQQGQLACCASQPSKHAAWNTCEQNGTVLVVVPLWPSLHSIKSHMNVDSLRSACLTEKRHAHGLGNGHRQNPTSSLQAYSTAPV